jgi:two-component system, NarL family, sensor histidine kinase FusK
MKSHNLLFLARVLILAVIYVGVARLGLLLSFVLGNNALVWPPTGIALAALLLFGSHLWPGIALGAFLASASTGIPLAVACGVSAGNTLEALFAVFLLRRVVRFQNALERLQDVFGLVGLAAGLSTMVSATIDVTSFCLGGVASWDAYGLLWRVWWLGGAMSNLVVAPLLLTWSSRFRVKRRLWRIAETGALLVSLVLVCLLVFGGWSRVALIHAPLDYAVFPFIIWAALRFSQREAMTATFVVSAIALWGTAHGFGPFVRGTVPERLSLLYAFMSVTATTALVLAAIVTARKQMEQALRAARDDLEARVRDRTAALRASNTALQAEVAAREQAERALQHERDLLEVTLVSIREAVIATNATAALTFLNPVAETLTGWPAREAIGRPIAEIFHVIDAQTRQVVENPVDKALREGREMEVANHIVLVARDGRETPVADSGAPIRDKSGQVQGAVVVFRDISASQQAEAALIRAKEVAEAADRTKSEFLATMSHELRTPLYVILGYTEVFLDGGVGSLSAEQVEILQRIDRNARVLFELISMLLDLNRLEAGRLPVETTEVRVPELLAEVRAETQGLCEQSGLACVWRVEEPLPALYTDPGKLKVVIKNLITNAVKFTKKGGIRVGAQAQGEGVAISVSDTGIGIPAEAHAFIFESFRQVDSSTTRPYSGSGLGLYIVKRLLELLGGTIVVESEVGRGSTFRVWVPTVRGVGTL